MKFHAAIQKTVCDRKTISKVQKQFLMFFKKNIYILIHVIVLVLISIEYL